MVETWKVIAGYENYEVSDLGRVRNVKTGKLLKPTRNKQGRYYVSLGRGNKKYVHQLVIRAFPEICGEYFEGAEVNHKDENPANNVAWNLEWCDRWYNTHYGTRNRRLSDQKEKKPIVQMDKLGNVIKLWESAHEAARHGYKRWCIVQCCNGKQYTSSGYLWAYASCS